MSNKNNVYLSECGILLQKVLDKKHPSSDKEYQELLSKLNFNQDFEELFQNYVKSLGLKIIPSQTELILVPDGFQSPFYMGYSDYSSKLAKLKDKDLNEQIHKKTILLMIHLSIIASFYPSESVILNEFDIAKTTTISDIANILIKKANFIKEEYQGQDFAKTVASLIIDMPHKNDNEDSQRKSLNIEYLYEFIEVVLNHLVDEKFIAKEKDSDKYIIKDKYKSLIKYNLDDILIKKFIKYQGEKNV